MLKQKKIFFRNYLVFFGHQSEGEKFNIIRHFGDGDHFGIFFFFFLAEEFSSKGILTCMEGKEKKNKKERKKGREKRLLIIRNGKLDFSSQVFGA